MLLTDIRPIVIAVDNPNLITENFAILTASTGKQYSSAYPEKFHGLFTYYLLKGLQGEARGLDRNLTIGELFDYIKKNVSKQAGYLDKEQDPTFSGGNRNKTIVKFK